MIDTLANQTDASNTWLRPGFVRDARDLSRVIFPSCASDALAAAYSIDYLLETDMRGVAIVRDALPPEEVEPWLIHEAATAVEAMRRHSGERGRQ